MKKILSVFLALTLGLILLPSTVFADMGPKEIETIIVQSPPDEPYYVDLLTQSPGDYENIDSAGYNEEMLALLHSFEDEGWYPALAGGTGVPLFGKLTGEEQADGSMRHRFSYFGVPNPFRVILVTGSGEIRVSEPITRKVLQSTTTYDYAADSWEIPAAWILYIRQFLATCIPTLLLEILLLFVFRFPFKQNILPVLIMNLVTQVFLTATMGRQIIVNGPTMYFLMLIPLEIVIFAVEMTACVFLLKGCSRKRRAAYAFTANLSSMLAGIAAIELAGKAFYSL